MVFDDLEGQPEPASAEAVENNGGSLSGRAHHEVMFQRDSLAAPGWEGRPAPALSVYTGPPQALRCVLQTRC